MNHSQSNPRRAAAQAFVKSLEQLQPLLQGTPAEPTEDGAAKQTAERPLSLQQLEEAIADLEQFTQQQPPLPEAD